MAKTIRGQFHDFTFDPFTTGHIPVCDRHISNNSELLENLEEMFPLHNMDNDVISKFKFPTTY